MSLSIFVTLYLFNVNASAETLRSANNNQANMLGSNKGTLEIISTLELRRALYIFDKRLKNTNRSPSLAPPVGRQRQSLLEDKLALINDAKNTKTPDNT